MASTSPTETQIVPAVPALTNLISTVEKGSGTSEFRLLAASLVWSVLGSVLAKHGITQADVTQLSVAVAPLAASVYAVARSMRKNGH